MASQMGGKMLVVDVNEDLSELVSNRPSPAWMGMMTAIERDIVRLLPYEYQVRPLQDWRRSCPPRRWQGLAFRFQVADPAGKVPRQGV